MTQEPEVKSCTNPAQAGSIHTLCGEPLVLIPWPYGSDSEPIEVCLVCDEVGSWPTFTPIKEGQK